MNIAEKIAVFSTNQAPRDEIIAKQRPASSEFSSHTAWMAFLAGMQILQRYAAHFPANAQSIAKSNLQLLHHSLLDDPIYCENVKRARQANTLNSLPTLRRVYANQGLHADLMIIHDGSSIKLATVPQCCVMYLLISGNARIESTQKIVAPTQQWWNRSKAEKNSYTVRPDDVVIVSEKQNESTLTANGKTCIALRVYVPTGVDQHQIAS